MTDCEIVQLALNGDEDAFRKLFDRHFSRVYKIGLTYSGYNVEDAKDISQKTFIRAFRRLDSLKDRSKFGPWITTIARNIAIRHTDKKRKRAETQLLEDCIIDEHLWNYHAGGVSDDEQARNMEIAAVRLIIETIPKESIRETVQMYYLEEGLSTEEIARKQGIPKSTVTSRLKRFRTQYRKTIVRRIMVLRGED